MVCFCDISVGSAFGILMDRLVSFLCLVHHFPSDDVGA